MSWKKRLLKREAVYKQRNGALPFTSVLIFCTSFLKRSVSNNQFNTTITLRSSVFFTYASVRFAIYVSLCDSSCLSIIICVLFCSFSLCLSLSLFLFLSFYFSLSLSLFLPLPLFLFVSLSIYLFQSVYLFISNLSNYPSISTCLPLYLYLFSISWFFFPSSIILILQ